MSLATFSASEGAIAEVVRKPVSSAPPGKRVIQAVADPVIVSEVR